MQAERWKQIDAILDATLEREPENRADFLTSICGSDADLRREVESLLAAHDEAADFIESPALELAAKNLAETKNEKRRVAHYEILSLLGAGGMSEVYLAQDTKLNRRVALKILPSHFALDAERVRRFRLEAQAVTALNHPHIVTIFDFGAEGGELYIATELVEGKDLRELSDEAKLPVLEILKIIGQVCEALQAAHAAGIIHRDIKPENIMRRDDGYVKVLDFGLVKLTEKEPNENRQSTKSGLVVGTLNYISPEQALGETLDSRTDLWSLGVCLFEMLTDKPPFAGSTQAAVFDRILHSEPIAPSEINAELEAECDRVVLKSLEKDRELRYQTAQDFRADLRRLTRTLDSAATFSGESVVTRSSRETRKRGADAVQTRRFFSVRGLIFAVGAFLIFGAVGLIFWQFFKTESAAPDWTKAANSQLTEQAGTEFFPSLAPDGKSFVFAAETEGNFDIFWQRIGGKNPVNLTKDATAADTQPAFSPDGERIAFRSEREPKGIYVMGASGENLRRIADFGFHPSWSPDGKEIVVSTFGRDQPTVRAGTGNGLWIINVETGAKRELLHSEASFPAWSPSGKRVAYWFYTAAFGRRDIATIPAGGGEPVIVAKDFSVSNWNPVWSPDGRFLYFVSSKGGSVNFWRVKIDETSGAVLSEPEPIVTPSKFSRHLNFSRDGKRMIYVQTNNQANIQGVTFDPKAGKIVGEPFWITQGDREITRAELSPDGKRFVMRMIRRTQDDIVTVSRDGRDWRDVTNDAPFDRYVRWSPDGKQLAFSSDRNAGGEVWMCNTDGTNLRQITFANIPDIGTGFPVFSPDGKQLAYTNNGTHILDLSKSWHEQTPQKLPLGENITNFATWDWSPDGKKLGGTIAAGNARFLGFYSFETNRYTKIAESGDGIPAWVSDSRRVVYGSENKIFIADTSNNKISELVTSPTAQLRSPFVSRDGRLLYFVAHSSESDIWLLNLD